MLGSNDAKSNGHANVTDLHDIRHTGAVTLFIIQITSQRNETSENLDETPPILGSNNLPSVRVTNSDAR